MIVCPVCEHQQAQGADCEVCGKRLVAGVSEADLAIPAVEGLEPTLHAPIDAIPDAVVALEPTMHAPAAAGPDDVTPDMEATATAPVDVVQLAPVPDVERTSAGIPGDVPTALPAIATCRYCRTPAMPGERLCTRCGMRLPVVPAPGRAAADAKAAAQRFCSCGTLLRPDVSLCPNCGARHRG
jgi:hypothetical protein